MAANIDTMMYVGSVPWHGLGVRYEEPPKTSEEIIKGAGIDWKVNFKPMYTEIHEHVMNYNAIYREDTNEVLGVVNKANPVLVQNEDTFRALDELIGESLDVETAASLGLGETVFGCFKIRTNYNVLDDNMDHYFVVVNDHLKVDGRVTVLNTPIRVVCQNTLSAALSSSHQKMRIPISSETSINKTLATNLMYSVENASEQLQARAEKLVAEKIDKSYVEKLLDVMFPYKLIDGKPSMDRSNERVSLIREQFLSSCMGADNLANYAGTQWQVFNALTDWEQHYFSKADKAYDLAARMKTIPGVLPPTETSKVSQFLKIRKSLAA